MARRYSIIVHVESETTMPVAANIRAWQTQMFMEAAFTYDCALNTVFADSKG